MLENRAELDAEIARLAPVIPVSELGKVERTILRSALFEVLYSAATPSGETIHDAVSLARTYAGDAARRLVNGVLGSVTQIGSAERSQRRVTDGTTFERLKKIIVEQLGVDEEEVTPQASFVEDLNADSLDLVELIMSLEEEFGMEISDEDAEKIQKVSDAVEFIEEHQQ